MKKLVFLTALLALMGAGCTKPSLSTPSSKNTAVNQPVQKSATQQTSMDIAGWKVFTEPTSGFSFKYPANWSVLSANTSYTICLSEVSTSQSCDIGVSIVKAPDERHPSGVQSNEELIAAFKKKYSSQTIGSALAVVNGLHTAKYSMPEETQIFIETATYDYVLAISRHDAAGNVRNNYTQTGQVLSLLAKTISAVKQ